MVARPLDHVHGQQRRIGHLHKEDTLARNVGNAHRVVAQRQGVKAVQNQTQVRVVGLLHNGPRLLVEVDPLAPGQGLVANAQVAAAGALGQLVQLRRRALGIAQRCGRGVGAHQHQRAAQLLHHIELALGTVQAAAKQLVGHAFKVAKRLVQVNAQAQVSGLLAQLAGAAGEADEVGLKQLNAIEARSGNGFELLAQGSAQRDGGNGSAHGYTSCLSNQWFRKAKGRAPRPPCGRQRQYLICATARSSSAVAVP